MEVKASNWIEVVSKLKDDLNMTFNPLFRRVTFDRNSNSSFCILLQNFHYRFKLWNNYNYYSFKIFPRFWLAKSTRIIHHNQLLMTKFERSLCLPRKWRQKCSPLQVNEPLTEKTWGRSWVVLVVKTKMADISFVLRVRTRRSNSKNNARTARRQLEGRHLLFGKFLRSWTTLNVHYRRWT